MLAKASSNASGRKRARLYVPGQEQRPEMAASLETSVLHLLNTIWNFSKGFLFYSRAALILNLIFMFKT